MDKHPKSKLGLTYYVLVLTIAIFGILIGWVANLNIKTELNGSYSRLEVARETARQHPVVVYGTVLSLMPLIHFYIVQATSAWLSINLKKGEKPKLWKVILISTIMFIAFLTPIIFMFDESILKGFGQ